MKSVEWKKGAKPELVLARLAEVTSVSDGGAIRVENGEHFGLMPILHNMLVYKRDYSFSTKVMFRMEAFSICANAGSLNKDDFIGELRKQVAAYDAADMQDFRLTSSLSISHGLLPARIKLPSSTVYCYSGPLPKKYSTRAANEKHWRFNFPNESPLPSQYTRVVVMVKAKNVSDAFHKAMHDLNFLRGLLGLRYNPEQSFSYGGRAYRPLNKVMLGGMHCIHFADGALSGVNSYWYEPHFSAIQPAGAPGNAAKEKASLAKYLRFRFKYISRYPAGDQARIVSCIARYALALDEFDYNATLHKLWSAMESLLIGVGQKSDVMIKRCSYVFDDPEYYFQVLTYLKDYRNAHIHDGVGDEEAERHCYSLQECYRGMIAFYFGMSDFFTSVQEANKFLDSSNDPQVIERQIELLQRAKRYIHSG
tara:strand:+ start:1329 stop:2594 length:1266 start_codon:yes stop_codon:yes gene_type:complete